MQLLHCFDSWNSSYYYFPSLSFLTSLSFVYYDNTVSLLHSDASYILQSVHLYSYQSVLTSYAACFQEQTTVSCLCAVSIDLRLKSNLIQFSNTSKIDEPIVSMTQIKYSMTASLRINIKHLVLWEHVVATGKDGRKPSFIVLFFLFRIFII